MILRPAPTRRAFTLAEVMISMAVVSIILVAIASVMRMATEQFVSTTNGVGHITKATSTIEQITAEVAMAKSITEQTATAITFTVPDRNGDSQDETIRYSWSGTAGAALVRTYNGTSANIADNVYYFNATYLTRTVGP